MESNPLPDKFYFRPDEVAKLFCVSTRAVYRWIDEGKLEAVRIAGSTIRIPREALQEIIEEKV